METERDKPWVNHRLFGILSTLPAVADHQAEKCRRQGHVGKPAQPWISVLAGSEPGSRFADCDFPHRTWMGSICPRMNEWSGVTYCGAKACCYGTPNRPELTTLHRHCRTRHTA